MKENGKKLIDSNKTRRYAAAAIISGALISSSVITGIDINCKSTNHLYDDCIKGKLLSVISRDSEADLPANLQHRFDVIKSRGKADYVYWDDIYSYKYDYCSPIVSKDGNKITYTAPVGYNLEYASDGSIICKSDSWVERTKIGEGFKVIHPYSSGFNVVVTSDDESMVGRTYSNDEYIISSVTDVLTFEESDVYTEPIKEDEDGKTIIFDGGGDLVEQDGKTAIKRRELALKKEND